MVVVYHSQHNKSSQNIMQFDTDLRTRQLVQYGTRITPIRIIENPGWHCQLQLISSCRCLVPGTLASAGWSLLLSLARPLDFMLVLHCTLDFKLALARSWI